MFTLKNASGTLRAVLFVGVLLTILLIPLKAHAVSVTCQDGTVFDIPPVYTDDPSTFCEKSGHPNIPVSVTCHDGTKFDIPAAYTDDPSTFCERTGHPGPTTTQTSADQPKYVKNDCNPKGTAQLNQNNCQIVKYLVLFVKFLSGAVGVVVIAMIIMGGIQYSVSQDDPAGVSAAKKRIFNAILAMVVYAFAFAILQYLIPGGVL